MSTQIPIVSGAQPTGGHLQEFNTTPLAFLHRAYAECGEVSQFDLGGLRTVLLVGPPAHEAFFRAADEQLSAAQAYQMMVPVFGEGIQYGAPPAIERQQLKMQVQGLKHERMVNYAAVVEQETEQFLRDWPAAGEFDIYDAFTRLTLKTSTHCLLGSEFRQQLTEEFAELYHALEDGLAPSSISNPFQDAERFRARDRARERLEALIGERVAQRRQAGGWEHDMLQVYMDATYNDGRKLTDHEITGMVIWFMFAGHHTSSNTTAWTLLEIARNPRYRDRLHAEIDALFADTEELTLKGLREIPLLDGFIREALRLHPPLNAITRRVMSDWHYEGYTVPAGSNIMVCPHISHKLPEYFPAPDVFDPERPVPQNPFVEIPFGGGRHKCIGNGFAILQVKAILSTLLHQYHFELAAPPGSYTEIMPALILRPSDPCVLRYRRRVAA
ncbi:MAG: cytochrome P450 [Haliea sp.]|nr:cytochrome P450 [Haliea sp.]